jgi:Kef-type K+ transport system membrane component KefB
MYQMPDTAVFLAQALVIVGAPYLFWHYLGLRSYVPLVVIQILCGILLGPSGMGTLVPEFWHDMFTKTSMAALSGLACLAVVLFSFLSGLHLDFGDLQRSKSGLALLSMGGVVVSVVFGSLAGAVIAALYPAEVGPSASSWRYALAIGVCLAVTALPVLSAILRESRLIDSRIGRQALACAAITDALLQLMLVVLVLNLGGRTGVLEILTMPILGMIYLMGLVFVVRPFLARQLSSESSLSETGTALVVGTAIASALLTDLMGFHYVIGGFAAGVIMPMEFRRAILDRLETVILVALLPFFFTFTGLKTGISDGSSAFIGMFLLVFSIAVPAKLLGTALPARWLGETWSDALTLGAMMQSKGLMEVIFLTVLYDAGVLKTNSFMALLLMALVTTAMAKPLLHMTGALKRQDVNLKP